MKFLQTAAVGMFMALPFTASAADFTELFPNHPGTQYPEVNEHLKNFDYQQGNVELPGGQITLTVPDGYYYLSQEDAAVVLTFFWGNPEAPTMGMLFPAKYTPMDAGAWGVDFQWEDIGYVSDEDADSYDYDDLLGDMKRDTRADSEARVDAGYDTIELVGWAEQPSYDVNERKLHWALELAFGDYEENTLNYELRALGREGVLKANFIASISQLEEVKAGLPVVAEMVAFNPGKTYAEFDPSMDKVAALGFGGLIAGKLAAKAGAFGVILLMLKKFWFIAFLPLLALKNRIFGKRA